MIRHLIDWIKERFFSDGYGYCLRCGKHWNVVAYHVTDIIEEKVGCFPLCEKCWLLLPPGARWPYYRQLFYRWGERDTTEEQWRAAVMAGR